jgi:hypothetical protein
MRHILAFAFFVSIAVPVTAQVDIRTPALEHYNACENFAIRNSAGGAVTQQGNTISYVCFGQIAQAWFNALPAESEHNTGRIINRFFGPSEGGMCSHVVETQSGAGTDEYVCSIKNRGPQ